MDGDRDDSKITDKDMIRIKLPDKVTTILKKGEEGMIWNGILFLDTQQIEDNMIQELCDWIVKLDGKICFLYIKIITMEMMRNSLGGNNITSRGASILFDRLRVHESSVKDLNLTDNKLDDDCMMMLNAYISNNRSVEHVNIGSNRISDKGIEILSENFTGNPSFKELVIQHNQTLTDNSLPFLIKMIESSSIERLDVTRTLLTRLNVLIAPLALNVFRNGTIKLDLSKKDITDEILMEICENIKKFGCEKVKEINFSQNLISSKGVSVLFDTLKKYNSDVRKGSFDGNNLDDNCMISLGEYLQFNNSVNHIDLSNNKITDRGLELISDYICGNNTIRFIGFKGNSGITDAAVPFLTEIAMKSFITDIDLLGTSMTVNGLRKVWKELSVPIDRREIPVHSLTKSAAKIS